MAIPFIITFVAVIGALVVFTEILQAIFEKLNWHGLKFVAKLVQVCCLYSIPSMAIGCLLGIILQAIGIL